MALDGVGREGAGGTAVPRRQPGHGLAPGSRISAVTTLDGLESLEPDWRRLESSGLPPHAVFQTFDWLRNWARLYAGGGRGLFIIAGHQDGGLMFLWPLMTCRSGPLTVLRWLSEPLAQYGDILLAPGQPAAPWLDAAIEVLAQQGGADTIRLRHVRDDAVIAPFLKQRFRQAKMVERAPWLDLSAFSGEAAYDARYTSSQRKRRRKIRKALEDALGPVDFKVLEPGQACDAALSASLAEKCVWIEERGRRNPVLGCPKLPAFLAAMSRRPAAAARMITTCLTAGGEPVSWEIGFRHGTTHFAFITSHVNALTDYSPGRLHMDLSQRLALRDGMTAFDLMIPYDAHKESWCSAMDTARDYHLPLTPAGRLYGRLYLEALRPALRAAYYRLPPALLRALKPLVRH